MITVTIIDLNLKIQSYKLWATNFILYLRLYNDEYIHQSFLICIQYFKILIDYSIL